MYWIKYLWYLWQYAIHRRADMNSMVMSMIRMESGWEKDHRMSHSLIQAYWQKETEHICTQAFVEEEINSRRSCRMAGMESPFRPEDIVTVFLRSGPVGRGRYLVRSEWHIPIFGRLSAHRYAFLMEYRQSTWHTEGVVMPVCALLIYKTIRSWIWYFLYESDLIPAIYKVEWCRQIQKG